MTEVGTLSAIGESSVHIRGLKRSHSRRAVMLNNIHPETLKSAICMFLAAVIVSSSLTVGAFGIHTIEQDAVAALASRS
jgi:hypothetical protein